MNLKASATLNSELKTFTIGTSRVMKMRFIMNAPASETYYDSAASPQCMTSDLPAGNLSEEYKKIWANYKYTGDEYLPWDSQTLYIVLQWADEKMYFDRITKQAKFSVLDSSTDQVQYVEITSKGFESKTFKNSDFTIAECKANLFLE